MSYLMIHSADLQSRLVVIIVFTHVVRTSVRTCVSTFQNVTKQNKFQVKTILATGESVGLAKWIIDNTCHIFILYCQCLEVKKSFSNYDFYSMSKKDTFIKQHLRQIVQDRKTIRQYLH